MSRNTFRATVSAFALGGALFAGAAPVLAQDVTQTASTDEATVADDIVVTAQRRAERSVDVPISVTAIGSDQLATANAQDLSDIAKVTPGLRFDTSGAFAQPTIRGIGTAVVTSGGGANVGIYIDGFYSPNPLAADSQLMNVQSVQVLKGPQGTLFGRNTTGGAILIQTADPSEEPAAQFKASYGRFNEFRAQGYATYGLAPGLAFDIEGMYRRGDGFVTNIVDGNDEIGKFKSWSVRAGLKMDFGEDVSLLIRYQHGDVNDPTSMLANTYVDPVDGPLTPGLALPSQFATDPNEVAMDRPVYFRSISNALQATLKADLGFADLTSYTQYRDEKVDASQNLDNSAAPINVGVILPGFQLGLPVTNKTWSQEFLFTSKPGGPLQWTAGLFHFSNRDTYQTYSDTFGDFRVPDGANRLGGSSTTTKSYAAFLDATYEVTPQFFVTAGVRYAHDQVTDANYVVGPATNQIGVVQTFDVPSIKSDRLTPRVVLRYKPTDETSVYASFTRGYKAAVIDVGGSCQNPTNLPTPGNPTGAGYVCNDVKPETINAYEVGFKYDDRRLSFDVSAFYYDYTNLQVSLYRDGRAAILNAASSEIYGIDGSVRYELFDGFQVNAGGAWTHARYKDFDLAPIYVRNPVSAGSGYSVVLTPLDNVTMQRTPEFTGNIGATYKTGLGGGELALSANAYYTSKFFFAPSGTQYGQKGYEVVSARAQWTDPSDTVTLAVFGDNLTSSRYLTAVQYNTFGQGANWSAPTTYGVEASVKF